MQDSRPLPAGHSTRPAHCCRHLHALGSSPNDVRRPPLWAPIPIVAPAIPHSAALSASPLPCSLSELLSGSPPNEDNAHGAADTPRAPSPRSSPPPAQTAFGIPSPTSLAPPSSLGQDPARLHRRHHLPRTKRLALSLPTDLAPLPRMRPSILISPIPPTKMGCDLTATRNHTDRHVTLYVLLTDLPPASVSRRRQRHNTPPNLLTVCTASTTGTHRRHFCHYPSLYTTSTTLLITLYGCQHHLQLSDCLAQR